MNKLTLFLIISLIFGIINVSIVANAENYSSTITVFRHSPVVAKFFKNSYGYAVFPTIGKGAYVIGGSYGEGQVYKHGKVTGKSTVIEGSIGFQAGGEAFSQIIFFKDKRAYDTFTSGSFEFDASAQAVAITAGTEMQVGTTGATAGATAGPRSGVHAETSYVNGMATFIHAKGGLMLGVSIGGQKFTFERK
jgi:lipid-binding SYLF domain-containing protein